MLADLGNLTSGVGRGKRRTGGRVLQWASILACAAVLALDFLPGAEADSRFGRRAVSREGRSKYVDREMFEDSLHHLRQMIETNVPIDYTFKCINCPLDEEGRPLAVRIMYFDTAPFTTNPKAVAKAEKLGIEYSCDNPKLAVPECFVPENWNGGWIGEFTSILLGNLNMNVTALTRANFSANVSEVYSGGSSYTRCVWEVYLGNVDLCVGDFWETDERRRISMFTSALDSDFFKLGTMPSGPVDSLNILGIFKPFHADLWTLNVFMIIISGLAIWFVEKHTPYNSDYDSEVLKHKPLGVAEGMAKAVWLKMATYVFGDPMVNSTTWPGRLIVLGFGFFCYITSSSYTANLASFMISDTTPVGFISKFGDIATMSGGLCLLEAMDGSVDVEGMTNVPFDEFIPALEGLYRGDCLGVMVGSNEWKIMVRGGTGRGSVCVDPRDTKRYATCEDPSGRTKMIELSGCKCKSDSRMDPLSCPADCPDHQKYCSIVEVIDDDFNFYVNLAMPVSLRIQNYISAWVIALRQDGTQSRLQQKYIKSVYPNVCKKIEEVSDSTPLSPSSMVGTFVTSGVVMMIGLICFWVQMAFDKYHIKPVLIDEKICMDPSLPKPKQKRLSVVVMETHETHMQSFQNLTSLGRMSNRSLPDSNGPVTNKFDSPGVGKKASIAGLFRKASSKSKSIGEGYGGQGAGAASVDQPTQMSQRISTKWPNTAIERHAVEPGLEPHGSLQELGAGWPRDALQFREVDEGAGGVLRREYEELCDRVLRHQRALAGRLIESSPSPTKPRGGDHLYSSSHSAMLPDPEETTGAGTAGHGFRS